MRRSIKILVVLLAIAVLIAVGFYTFDRVMLAYSRAGDFEVDTLRKEKEVETPMVMYGMTVNHLHITEDHVRRGQRFIDLFLGHHVSDQAMKQLHLLPRSAFDFRKIVTGRKYTLISERDSLQSLRALIYEVNPIDYYVFRFEDSVRVEVGHRAVDLVSREIAGVIGSTLSETMTTIGLSPELTNRFVDIFAWQIDFQRLQRGDRFKLLYEELNVEGRVIGIGDIQGIFFEHALAPFYAIPFDQGGGVEFFDSDGNSLRKALLKYPIEFTRISSRFNPRRFHPIARVFRAHRGTDLAAPVGTPIRTVGDGVVLEAQYNGNNGNYVKIRHNSAYVTQYLHMSRIASGLRPGDRVVQGETIGFVGSTGLATGPHLCYRFWKNGAQVDALRVQLPPSQPIKSEFRDAFEQKQREVFNRLDKIILPEPPLAALP